MKIFGKKGKAEDSKPGILITVMGNDPVFVVIDDFQISLVEAISKILTKLNLPKEANEGIKMKYFLYHQSRYSDDGFTIMAETDTQGSNLSLIDYGIGDKSTLYLGAIMLPKLSEELKDENQKNDQQNESEEYEYDSGEVQADNNDDMIEL